MNRHQELWWLQARSDHEVLLLLRRNSAAACHQLHYIQMVTEKLAKAYLWRSAAPPARSHAGFVLMMRLLGGVRRDERKQIAAAFQFARFEDFQRWTSAVLPLVHRLERMVPDLANDGPNTEYPWPHAAPAFAPATFTFDVWRELTGGAHGRRLLQVIRFGVERFPLYA